MAAKGRFLIGLILCSFVTSLASAQTLTGTPPFNSYGGGPDVINLGNLNVHWDIPIINKAGRGTNFTYDLKYDSSIWQPVTSGSTKAWEPVGSSWGWTGLSPAGQSYASYDVTTSQGSCGQYGNYTWQSWSYSNITYIDQYGASHSFAGGGDYIYSPSGSNQCPPNGPQPSTPQTVMATDGSGIKVTWMPGEDTLSLTFVAANGTTIDPPIAVNSQAPQGSLVSTDNNGNEISTNGNGVYTDTLGVEALSVIGTEPSNTTLNFTNPSGNQSSYTVSYTAYNIQTNFGCSGISEYKASSVYLVNKITLPDGRYYQFQYEPTPDYSGYYTGRVASATLPTGGEISYSYTGTNAGVECQDGSAAGMTRTTPDGTWTYARSGSVDNWTTTITDPATNKTVIAFVTPIEGFVNFYELSRELYSGSTLVETISTCWVQGSCSSAPGLSSSPAYRQVTVQMQGTDATAYGYVEDYDGYGNLTEHDDHAFASGSAFSSTILRKILNTYAYSSNQNEPVNLPASVTVEDGSGNIYAETQYAYDQSVVTTTTGTPQHASGTNVGNLTTLTQCISSGCSTSTSTALASTYTYFDTGNVNVATDVNGAQTSYTYGACGNSFPTEIGYPVNSLKTQATWNCTGGVQLTSVDPNSNTATYTYADANYWRITKTTDPWGNATIQSYPTGTGASNMSESVLTFNSGNSTTDLLTQYDSQGRVELTQQRQAPGSSTFDISAVSYDAFGRPYEVSLPYSGSAGTDSLTPGKKTLYDALGRSSSVTDSGGGTTSYTYDPKTLGYQNDVLVTVGPAPSGENTKRRQLEYDALGRLGSVCEVTSLSGSGTCSESDSNTGYWTEYTYDPANRLLKVQQNAQSSSVQTRTVSYDWLDRKTSETIPETGTTHYTYDSDSTGVCSGTYKGDLVKIVDAVGNSTCITYDLLHRPLTAQVVSGSYESVTQQVHYVYDSASLNGTAMQNVKGTLAEAWTCASGSCPTKATDVFFSYFPESGSTGRLVAQVYEMTPHSSPSYYLTQDTYYPNGTVGNITASLSGSSIGVPNVNLSVDGMGRLYSATDTTHSLTLTSSASYNPAGYPTQITIGNQGTGASSDVDSFQYDPNTFRLTQFKYAINPSSNAFTITGALTWNANWSLTEMAITDTSDSSKNQTCNYGADDLQRLASVNCAGAWEQTFTYDPFGNITKTANPGPGTSYAAGYSYLTNHVGSGVTAAYDANGNQTQNTWATFVWNAANQPVTVNGISATYDALGRMVETTSGSTHTQYVYRRSGDKLAILNGSTLLKAVIPLPGGGAAVYNGSGLSYLRHKDWLGSSRLATTWIHGIYAKEAYGPFGEPYNEAGTADRSFTGQDQDTTQGIYDYMFRRYDPTAGRWLSPDPAGWNSITRDYPQSLNRYAYVENNPLSQTDRNGLDCIYVSSDNSYYIQEGDCTSDDDDGVFVDGSAVFDSAVIDPETGQVTLNFDVYQAETDSPISDNVNGTEWSFSTAQTYYFSFVGMTKQQFVSALQQQGFSQTYGDDLLGAHLGTNLRDNSATCSVHLIIDQGGGQYGSPVTGSFHIDSINPFQFPIEGVLAHGAADVIPDVTNWYTPGNTYCPNF